MEAAAVIVTIHDQAAIDEIVAQVRALRPDILIVSRARDADHARHLYASASPTRCRKPSRRACSCRKRRWSAWACRPDR